MKTITLTLLITLASLSAYAQDHSNLEVNTSDDIYQEGTTTTIKYWKL